MEGGARSIWTGDTASGSSFQLDVAAEDGRTDGRTVIKASLAERKERGADWPAGRAGGLADMVLYL